MTEHDWIELLRASFRGRLSPGAVELGNDCAAMTPPAEGEHRVVTSDQMIEGVHFYPSESGVTVGHRALVRNLSDLASCGATPHGFMWTLCFPEGKDEFVKELMRGAAQACHEYDISLLGGDLSRNTGGFVASITAFGDTPVVLGRSGATVGDTIYVSGKVGAGAVGLRSASGRGPNAYLDGYLRPRAHIAEGIRLRSFAASCMDISDGLVMDLSRLMKASGVGAELDLYDIPLSDGATLDDALYGGDDYVLLFTASRKAEIPPFAMPIGRVVTTRGVRGRSVAGVVPLLERGHDPFSREG